MGAPKGNQFWKLRSKHGRDKLFSSPEILWEEACKYFEWCDENPLGKIEKVSGEKHYTKEIQHSRVYTWEGLELFLGLSNLSNYKTNEDYKDFFEVVTRIDKIIYNQKFTGAASGLFNSNIIARDLGLKDRSDVTSDGAKTGVIILPSNGREQ